MTKQEIIFTQRVTHFLSVFPQTISLNKLKTLIGETHCQFNHILKKTTKKHQNNSSNVLLKVPVTKKLRITFIATGAT